MRKHAYKAYKDKNKVENIIIDLFKVYKIRKQMVLQKIEHVCGSVSLNDQEHSPHHRGEDLLQQLYACDGSSTESSSQKPGVPTDSHYQHHRKEENENLHTKSYKAKLERLCLARLTRHDQAVNF
jgi:hypothetical protein